MRNKRTDLREGMKSGLNALIQPTAPTLQPQNSTIQAKSRYKTCNYLTDPSHHNRLKRYATDNGMTLLQAFNEAIDLYLSDKGERYL